MKWVRQRCQWAPANTTAMAFAHLLSQGLPLVSIGGNQFNAAGAHVHVQDLMLPVGDPRSHYHADVDDAAAHVAHFAAAVYRSSVHLSPKGYDLYRSFNSQAKHRNLLTANDG